jgi:uncharacterized protein YndB with AHSA1/START domain
MDMLTTYDWSKFVCRINVNAPIDKIYDAWTIPALQEKWFLSQTKYIPENEESRDRNAHVKKNDLYQWHWYGYSKEVTEKGTILEANGKDLFQFTFGGDTIVTVILKTEDGENIVELWQENIPKTEVGKVNYHLNCMQGWTFYLANLKSFLEGGLDLRNKNESLKQMINS